MTAPIALLAGLALAGGDPRPPILVVIGSSTSWSAACVERGGACSPEERITNETLDFADDDAWRVTFVGRPGRVPDRDLFLFSDDADLAADLGVPAHPPTLAMVRAMLATVPSTDDRDVLVYVAAHGSAPGLHLADGLWSLPEVVAAATSDGARHLELLIADACLSARWPRWRGSSTFVPGEAPPIEPSPDGWIELSVDSPAPEDADLRGGRFTRVVLSALVGGADVDEDGLVDVQEANVFVHRGTRGTVAGLAPVVRAPDARRAVPELGGDAELWLTSTEPARWLVTVDHDRAPLALADVSTVPGRDVRVRLPAGSYTVWEAGGSGRDQARACPVVLEPATSVDGGATCAVTYRAAGVRERGAADMSEPTLPLAIESWLSTSQVATAAPTGIDQRAYHGGGDSLGFLVGALDAPTAVPRDELYLAGALHYDHAGRLGRIRGDFGAEASAGLVTSPELARGRSFSVHGGVEIALAARRTWWVGALGRLGGGSVWVLPPASLDAKRAVAPFVDAEIGLTARWIPGTVGILVEGAWAPALTFPADGDGHTIAVFRPGRGVLRAGPVVRF